MEISGHTVAIIGFYFKGLAEARVDFSTFNSEGVELPSDTQGNTFGVKDVMAIMSACKDMAEMLINKHCPERISFEGAEEKRFRLYQKVAKKLSAGREVWIDTNSLTVWIELQDGWN